MFIRVEILNWQKYNPKRAQKTYTWLRLENNIALSRGLHGLTGEQKWAWVVLLCEASKDNKGVLEIDTEWLADLARVKKNVVESLLRTLAKNLTITLTLPSTTPDYTKLPLRTYETYETYETNENILPNSPLRVEHRRAFDFELLYKEYPRKEGKHQGMLTCRAQIKTEEDFLLLKQAITRYSEHVKKTAQELRFVKHFSTFMSSWRDWLEPDTGTALKEEEPEWVRLEREKENRNAI